MKEAPPQKKGENIFGGPRLRQKKKELGHGPRLKRKKKELGHGPRLRYSTLELFALSRFRCLVLFGSDLG